MTDMEGQASAANTAVCRIAELSLLQIRVICFFPSRTPFTLRLLDFCDE
jgi:hypothetical protein